MCGICGFVDFRPAAAAGPGAPDPTVPPVPNAAGAAESAAARRVTAMLAALAHRGPDASAQHAAGGGVLGATRLSIRGIHDGRQPLVEAASGVTVVCNGEIDNHRELKEWLAERGRPVAQATDVAVIPGLYLELGDAFVERLVGAFAIGLWDPRAGRLVLARDRAGEKPLFFATADRQALFASETAALAATLAAAGWGSGGDRHGGGPPAIDREAMAHYLRFGCFAVPRTPFAAVQKVGPGEHVVLDAGGVERRRYWRWRSSLPAAAGRAASSAEADRIDGAGRVRAVLRGAPSLDSFDRVFRQAIARQIDVEVPCGVFLSGGVDSSLVTAVARAVRPDLPLRAFSLRFPDASYDEGEAAARVARHLGVTATEVWVRPEDFTTCLPELVRMTGEPLADPAWVPAALLARRAAADVRQVLVGEGGDELFGGYPTHSGVWLAERYNHLPRLLRRAANELVRRLPATDKKVAVSFLLKRFVAAEGLDGMERHLLWTSNIAPEILARLGAGGAGNALRLDPPPAGTILSRVQQHDLETTLAEGLLTKADRSSMHFALELRAPFLDRDVMELAAGLPDGQRVRGLRTKVFLKDYALRYLPRWVVHARKRGLSVPLQSWLRGPLRGWARERLASGRLAAAGIDETAALALFDEHLRRERDHARALWTLVVLAEWLDWAQSLGAGGARDADNANAADNADAADAANDADDAAHDLREPRERPIEPAAMPGELVGMTASIASAGQRR
jgi:asparagine synthase (glutamine-hydrolysing)